MKESFLFAAVAAVALTSCNNENNEVAAPAQPQYITVTTSIGGLTRVSTSGTTAKFDEGDKISVYAWTGSAEEGNSAKLTVNNAINTLTGAKWVAAPMMKWTDMVTPHYFLSVYPNRVITDFKVDAVKVDPAKQEESDLLVATNFGDGKKGLIATNNPVSLKFDHMMSKLVVKLEYRNEFSGTPTVTSTTTQAKNAGSIDYIKGSITPSGSEAAFALPTVTANKEFASIIMPQNIQTVTVVIDGKNYVYTHPTPLTLEKGKIQTIKLIVGRNRIELDQVTINDWGTAEDITGGEAID